MTETYRVAAHNTSKASENKIHDDAVARRFGFKGGLVPGVDVYAYMVHPAIARWGRAWLERGRADIRLLRPVYDGAAAIVSAAETADGLDLRVDSNGDVCASGRAVLPGAASPPPAAFAEAPVPPAPPAQRPPASEATLPPGRWLAARPLRLTGEVVAEHLRDVRETDPLCLAEGLAHPSLILRTANWVMNHNVVFGPWMHVGSTVQHFAAARVGDELSARGRVTANYERKGHRFVECDVLVYVNGATPVARIAHVAIWQPRQVAAA
jgi:hypothetical protein